MIVFEKYNYELEISKQDFNKSLLLFVNYTSEHRKILEWA